MSDSPGYCATPWMNCSTGNAHGDGATNNSTRRRRPTWAPKWNSDSQSNSGISEGTDLDWEINAHDVDCKFSKDFGGWEIPMEMYLCDDHEQSGTADHLALLVWMNDDDAQWAAGVVQIRDELLRFRTDDSGRRRRQYNRDNKRRLNDDGMDSTYWLWGWAAGPAAEPSPAAEPREPSQNPAESFGPGARERPAARDPARDHRPVDHGDCRPAEGPDEAGA